MTTQGASHSQSGSGGSSSGGYRRPEGGGPRRPGGGRRYVPRRRVCQFCAEKTVVLDYKNVDLLRRYVSDRGRIEPRRKSGTCARHQRVMARHLKRARHLGLVPYVMDIARDSGPGR